MKDSDINTQRNKHLTNLYIQLSSRYTKAKDFDAMPESLQKALFDRIFKLGQTKLRSTFTRFNEAVKKRIG